MRIINENGLDLKRVKGNEEPKSKYYIVPEGDNTEIQYFCGIKENADDLNIKPLIEILPVINDEDEYGQSHPKRKLENFNNDLKSGRFTYIKGFDKVIFIIDRDPQNLSEKQLNEFINDCNNKGYFIGLSNPTFELFLLMHDDRIFQLDRNEMLENKKITIRGKRFLERKLSEFFECNKNNLKFDRFRPNIKKAIENEAKFCEDLEKLKTELGSNVGKILDSMIEE